MIKKLEKGYYNQKQDYKVSCYGYGFKATVLYFIKKRVALKFYIVFCLFVLFFYFKIS